MIATTYEPPAIPVRDYDWSARFTEPKLKMLPGAIQPEYNRNGEPNRSFGRTEREAIENLLAATPSEGTPMKSHAQATYDRDLGLRIRDGQVGSGMSHRP